MADVVDGARTTHQAEVTAFLAREFGAADWRFDLPPGSGHETYFAAAGSRRLFVKLGARAELARALAVAGLGPDVLAVGSTEDGTTIMVQPQIDGRTPTKTELQARLERIAAMTGTMHRDAGLQALLPPSGLNTDLAAGLSALGNVQTRWETYRPLLSPEVVTFVDEALVWLAENMWRAFGDDMVAAHSDFCNANWLLTPDDRLYIIDLEMMGLDDPAADLGPFLWWYYPPESRPAFLAAAGYSTDSALLHRMQLRTALHLLSITLPREASFDSFDPASYESRLGDFRAALEGEQNPQGYL